MLYLLNNSEERDMKVYVDEVGCASIAGPVMTCAVAVADDHAKIPGVKDSKQLSKQRREALYPVIADQLQYAFGSASPQKIERMNIHWAKLDAMRIAVERLARAGVEIEKVIIDGGFTIPNLDHPQEAVVKADAKFWQCGAASILAKVKRDGVMTELGKIEKYSHFQWESNAGYYSPAHRDGIILHGPTELHRKGFEYFKYCMACHRKYLEFAAEGKTAEDYFAFVKEREGIYKKSDYVLWRDNALDNWQEVKYGEAK